MGMILSACTPEAFREYRLPSEKNMDYRLILPHASFGIGKDLAVGFENISGHWRICPGSGYEVYSGSMRVQAALPVSDRDLLRVVTENGENITFLVRTDSDPFTAYRKYTIKEGAEITIGRKPDCQIRYNNQELVARTHAVLRMENGCFHITNCSSNGLYVNGVFMRGESSLAYGDSVNILGLHLVFLGRYLALYGGGREVVVDESSLEPADEGILEEAGAAPTVSVCPGRRFHRSPRYLEIPEEGTINLEDPPRPAARDTLPLFYAVGPSVTMVLPMACGSMLMMAAVSRSGGSSGLFLYSGLVMAGTSAAVGVFWALMNRRRQAESDAMAEELRFEAYSSYLLKKKEEIRQKYQRNREIMNRRYPSAKACLAYSPSSPELWNRNPDQQDFLIHRLGIGDAPFQVRISTGGEKFSVNVDPLADKPLVLKQNFETLHQVPITVDLGRFHRIGVISDGTRLSAREIVRLIMIQAAANNCYTDVRLALVYDGENPDACEFWSFARWLPHVWSDDRKTRYLASDKKEAGDIFFEMSAVFRHRKRESAGERKLPGRIPYYILIVDDQRLLEGEAICGYLFDHAGECGITAFFLASSYDELPNSCDFFIEQTKDFSGIYEAAVSNLRTSVRFDEAGNRECEEFSRRICGTEAAGQRGEGKLPSEAEFLELYRVTRVEDLMVKERWLKARVNENIRACIGRKTGNLPMFLDIHEKYHGPHGLVAGMTGSGKSEALQTFILSLAVNYSPDDIAFFIIDYKGGGLANLFRGLPHMAGSISNLSGNQVQRAMVSIKSENTRRQMLLNRYQANHINTYTRLYKNGEAGDPLPHLLIVIDEFAELKKEEPDFMRELISVAQVGRSLGVHLILATQKPGGTVDENIRSNSRFRICLRVQNRQDSLDMLGKADAADLTGVGRCCFQVGNDEIYEQFQAGYSGAPYHGDSREVSEMVRLVSLTGKRISAQACRNPGFSGKSVSQLEKVKESLIRTAAEEGYCPTRLLWLPALPSKLILTDLDRYIQLYTGKGRWLPCGDVMAVQAGLVDIPDRQAQETLEIVFPDAGHIAVCGTVVSGKSTFLQTILFSMVTRFSPEQVNIYGIDLSGRSMECFAEAPHVGGMMYENDGQKMKRFFHLLERMMENRKEAFRGVPFADYLRSGGREFPAVLIVIDNYGTFREKTGDSYENSILSVSREGLRLGIFLVLSSAGFGMNEIGNRLRENISTVFCLGMEDRFASAEIFRTGRVEIVPSPGIRGRGLAVYDGRILEFQTALPVDAEDDYGRLEKIGRLCLGMRSKYTGPKAAGIPDIPDKASLAAFLEEEGVREQLRIPDFLPVAYREEDAGIFCLRLPDYFCFLVTGARRTGKTNFLKVVLTSALQKGLRVFVIDSPEGKLGDFRDRAGISYAQTEDELVRCFGEELSPILEERSRRKQEQMGKLAGASKESWPVLVMIIGDLEYLLTTAYRSDRNIRGFLEMLFGRGQSYRIFAAGALDPEKKSQVSGYAAFRYFASARTGIHFGGKTIGNTLLDFDDLDYKEQSRTQKPGLGILSGISGEAGAGRVVVPLCGEDS